MREVPYCYGQKPLQNDVVLLVPFDPDKHLQPMIDVIKKDPAFLQHTTFPLSTSHEDFIERAWKPFYSTSSTACLFAVLDKTRGTDNDDLSRNAGIVTTFATKPEDATTEIGVMILPAFHRSHVASNAVGLLLYWLLDSPAEGGLGLRRVEWQANVVNMASRNFATKMGFQLEGIARWHKIVLEGKPGSSADALAKQNGAERELPGRHTAIYSLIWEEWLEKRSIITKNMAVRLLE